MSVNFASMVEWDAETHQYRPRADVPVVDLRPKPALIQLATITAAGKRIPIDNASTRALVKRSARWQQDAWDAYDTVPEIKNAVMQIGNLLSRIRLYAAWTVSDREPPVALDDEMSGASPEDAAIAVKTLHELDSSIGGMAGVMKSLGQNWTIAGECYILKLAAGDESQRDPERDLWAVKSIDELTTADGEIYALEHPRQQVTDACLIDESRGDYLARMWQMHPRFANQPDANIMSVLDVCEELHLLGQESRARSRSRMGAGLLTMPHEVSFGSAKTETDAGGESGTDPLDEELQEIIITPIEDEGHPSAVAPIVLRGPGELLGPDYIRWITFHRNEDDGLDVRREKLTERLARGLPLPVESVLGHQKTTFANAQQVSIDEYRSYIEPLVLMVVWALTTAFYRPFLVEQGVADTSVKRLVIWYDPSEIVTPPDQTESALKLHEQYAISFEALRRAGNYTEADAPTNEEIALRVLLQRSQVDPALAADLMRTLLGVEVVSGQEIGAPGATGESDGTGANQRE